MSIHADWVVGRVGAVGIVCEALPLVLHVNDFVADLIIVIFAVIVHGKVDGLIFLEDLPDVLSVERAWLVANISASGCDSALVASVLVFDNGAVMVVWESCDPVKVFF